MLSCIECASAAWTWSFFWRTIRCYTSSCTAPMTAALRYRMLSYWGLLKEGHGRPVRQVVLYVGGSKLNMQNRLDEDGNTFSFETIDIRSIDAAVLITSKNPADLALAILAGGGDALLPEILNRRPSSKAPRAPGCWLKS